MTQYLLSVIHDWDADMPAPDEMQKQIVAVSAFNDELEASGSWVFGGGLMPPKSAKVVDARAAKVLTTDGPYTETKEQLGGFWIIEVADEAAALEWARKGSAACVRSVEVRPFQGP